MKLVNGCSTEVLSLSDRAIQFGDGVFRTLKYQSGRLLLWDRHYRKLASDAAVLGIQAPEAEVLLADIQALIEAHGRNDAAIKIILTRGESARGYAIPTDIQSVRIVQLNPLPSYPIELYQQGAKLHLCEIRASWQPALAGVKHLNRLENVLARREWQDASILEGVMLDRDGHVLDGVMSNILIRIGSQFISPKLDTGGVAGVMRAIAQRAAGQMGWRIEEEKIGLARMGQANQVWICNSLMGVMPVASLAQYRWPVDAKDLLRQQSLKVEQEESLCF